MALLLESGKISGRERCESRLLFRGVYSMNRVFQVPKVCLVALLVLASGCFSVTSRPDGGFKTAGKPTFEQRQDFYLWGLVGESHIDTKAVCSGKQPVQMQSQRTLVDGLLGLVTLGIYAPESARVWCS